MRKEEILTRLVELRDECDTEQAHQEADELLCNLLTLLGHADVVTAFNNIAKWYA